MAALRGNELSQRAAFEPALLRLRAAENHHAFMDADLQLHLAIAESSGNAALLIILTSLHNVISLELAQRTRNETAARRATCLQEHERIVDVIGSGDPAAARAAMLAHFRRALPSLYMPSPAHD